MNVTANRFLGPVIDGRVSGVRNPDLLVRLQFVGVDGSRFVGNDGVQGRSDLTPAIASSLAEAKLAAALDSTQDGRFVSGPVKTLNATSPASLTVFLKGLDLAADESFISLNDAR